jgi:DNA polymerase-3 subunit delta'
VSPFDRIVGHERALGPLRRALAEGRLHPALLFHGPEGVGKRLAAFALAAALNCPEAPGEGCGACPSCRRVLEGHALRDLASAGEKRAPGRHADVLFYPPRRRQILLEQIQDLCREAGFRPFEGRRRVFLVDPADRMNREAANALLKTLEEPPGSTCIVLITASPDGLPPTIRSRCQAVRFAPLPVDDLAALLAREGRPAGEARRLARLASGSVGRAAGIDLAAHDALRERTLAALEPGGDGLLRALGLAAEAGAAAGPFEDLAAMLASLLRDLALLQEGAADDALVHDDVADRLRPLAGRLGPGAPAMLDRVEEAVRRTRGNVNPRLAAEAILLPLAAPR